MRGLDSARIDGRPKVACRMSSLFRVLLVISVVVVGYLILFAPARLRRFGFHAKRVGFAYVAAILISAFVRIYFGWGT